MLAVAHDGGNVYLGQQDIWVPVNHQQVSVVARADRDSISWPDNRVNLAGTIGGAVPDEILWEVRNEAGDLVTLGGDARNLETWVEFDTWGEFNVSLTAMEVGGFVIGVDVIKITIAKPDFCQ